MTNRISWGMELEFGDVSRNLDIPKELGFWNYDEKDIVNQREPYWGIAADPLGINPPVGGEINTIPTYDYHEQVVIFEKLKQFFIDHDCPPTASCVSNTHVHVHIPGLRDNLGRLKSFMSLIYRHQEKILRRVYGRSPGKNRLRYLKLDSGREYPQDVYDKIMASETTVDFFSRCVVNPNNISERYLLNFISLLKNNTLEFRFFRCTTEVHEIESIIHFCNDFVHIVLENRFINYDDYTFPKLELNEDLFYSWKATRKTSIPPIRRNFLSPV